MSELELLKIALIAAHKMDLNRHFYKYDWMNRISYEMVELERSLPDLQRAVERLDPEYRRCGCNVKS